MSWVLALVALLLTAHLVVARMEVRALYGLCAAYRRMHQSDRNMARADDDLIKAMRAYIAVIETQNTHLRIAAEEQARKVRN